MSPRAVPPPSVRTCSVCRAWLHGSSGPLPLAKRGPLARYSCRLERQLALPASPEDASAGISLPAPLPFPAFPLWGPLRSRRRRRSRWAGLARARGWVIQLISLYNFVELGCRKIVKDYGDVRGYAPPTVGLAAWASSTAREVRRFGRLAPPPEGAGGGRGESLSLIHI